MFEAPCTLALYGGGLVGASWSFGSRAAPAQQAKRGAALTSLALCHKRWEFRIQSTVAMHIIAYRSLDPRVEWRRPCIIPPQEHDLNIDDCASSNAAVRY
jgi:hypothetical protein